MKFIYPLTIACLFSFPAFANHGGSHDHGDAAASTSSALHEAVANAQCDDTTNVKVNGLVCDFCARALEKVFSQHEEVAGINVDLNNGNVTVAFKSGQTLDDETLKSLITDAGYNVVRIDRGC